MKRLLALALLLAATPALAADAVTRLADLLGAARTMEASFVQVVTGSNGVLVQEARGLMTVARPQLFRWDVRQPFEQLIVADGRQVWVYDPDLAQAVVRPFDQQLADTPALLFSGDAAQVARHFSVTLLGEAGGTLRFELRPKRQDALFESLKVSFANGRLSEMYLQDSLGQKTAISFSNVSLNAAVPASRFTFQPPPGTDIIREGD